MKYRKLTDINQEMTASENALQQADQAFLGELQKVAESIRQTAAERPVILLAGPSGSDHYGIFAGTVSGSLGCGNAYDFHGQFLFHHDTAAAGTVCQGQAGFGIAGTGGYSLSESAAAKNHCLRTHMAAAV
mgnify:CR=1 FL=1